MDGDNSLNIRNWGYYEPPSLNSHLGLQLVSSMPEKPLLSAHNATVLASSYGTFYHRDMGTSQVHYPMGCIRDTWMNHRDKFLNVKPGNPNYAVSADTSVHNIQMVQPTPQLVKEEQVTQVEEAVVERDIVPNKKREGPKSPKSPKAKKGKRGPRALKDNSNASVQRVRSAKKTAEIVINGQDIDISGIAIPVCSCTGAPQQCYRWGCGGWQSACCTTNMSLYPLPMSTKRRGARIAGRKMSVGAFKKVLEKLASEAYDFSNPIDLRTHWAKHGTNKFVTIR
ncbi:hypothetical protein SLEP1_g31445 [Rubroshorea leprosula]|uniref:GAGA-binding transcriptional activator n=1 Tax=Rubroshorea leprosula TaxID=152421 RepID=A0AAV5K9V7_9ROSI|nr:hypothetical protein SLEP1_g31445 [Rubroshorea leprosula]